MAEDLERRERVFEVERSQEKAARNKLQVRWNDTRHTFGDM